MKKSPLYFLFVAAILGGILCDKYIGTAFPFFTLAFVCISAIIFYTFTRNTEDEDK